MYIMVSDMLVLTIHLEIQDDISMLSNHAWDYTSKQNTAMLQHECFAEEYDILYNTRKCQHSQSSTTSTQ